MLDFVRAWVFCGIGLILLHGSRTQSIERAEKAFLRSIASDSKCVKALFGLGFAQYRLGRCQQAVVNLEHYVEKRQTDARGLFQLAKLYASLSEPMQAKVLLERARNLSSNSAIEHNLGLAYEDLGMFDEALECYIRGAQFRNPSPYVYLRLGYLLNKRADYSEATEAYKNCLRIDPNLLFAHIGLGHSYVKMGEYDKGRRAYQIATVLDPESSQAREGFVFAEARLENDQD